MIVCVCHNISDSHVKSAIQEGWDSMHLLREKLELGTCCGKCKSCTKKILRESASENKSKKPLHQVIQLTRLAV